MVVNRERTLIYLSFLSILLVLSPSAVKAQETIQPPPLSQFEDLSSLPDEYIEESFAFHNECTGDNDYYNYYDCNCLAMAYLDARVKAGAETHHSLLKQNIRKLCLDPTGMTGELFNNCLNDRPDSFSDLPQEEFCTCYANTFGKLFEYYKIPPSSSVTVTMRKQARIACRDRELALRLYPYVPAYP